MNYQQNLQALLLRIPRDKVTSYRELAHAMNMRGYRFVGQLLRKNPEPDQYPCYKVVHSDGKIGGFAMGQKEKIRRLQNDGIIVKNGVVTDFARRLYRFKA